MRIRSLALSGLLVFFAGTGLGQTPMSAIDWLSQSAETPFVLPEPLFPREEAVTGSAAIGTIKVTSLDDIKVDAVGLVPAEIAGLPQSLWGTSSSTELARLLGALGARQVPAMQDLLFSMLLAELDPPADSDPQGTLFLARIDALVRLGAVEQAQALLERAGPNDAPRFQRWFNTSLLTGTEDAACEKLRNTPDFAPSMAARIFCLARGGDWNAAALTLETGRALGEMTAAEDALLTRFLDPEIFEGAPPLPVPSRPNPLTYRLYEAIGESLPTTTLPVAFAQADLRSNTGWKAQLEAAERLARSGALADNKLLGLYTERSPAASGGIWDRVAAIQRFDIAIAAQSDEVISTSLPKAWAQMQRVDLESVFAGLYATELARYDLSPSAASLAFRLQLLAPGFESAAANLVPTTAEETFLHAIALGVFDDVAATGPLSQAILDGFISEPRSGRIKRLIENKNLGEVLLISMANLQDGVEGNVDRLSHSIASLRAAGFEKTARGGALQVLILNKQ